MLMDARTDLLLDLNILSRATQKYYDRQLQPFNLTYAQLPVLLMIYESEGITANQIVNQGQYDKGTVTKNVQKLEALGYIESSLSRTDKRLRHLYTTDLAKTVIAQIYAIRRDWWNHLMTAIPCREAPLFLSQTRALVENAIVASNTQSMPLLFYRMERLSARAWPGRLAMVLHVTGCNFRCPGCQQRSRIMLPEEARLLDPGSIREEIDRRSGFVDGIVITGGEPFLQNGLISFLRDLKDKHIPVRIKTNGLFPDPLACCLQEGLVQEVSLEIRNDLQHYAASAGLKSFDPGPLTRSLKLLGNAEISWDAVLEVDDSWFQDSDPGQLAALLADADHIRVINHKRTEQCVDPNLGPMDEHGYRDWKERLEK